MPTDLPFSVVTLLVLGHTPIWVWGVLALITALGIRQAGDHVIPAWRLALAPVALGAYSLWGSASAFGVHAEVFAAWAAGAALAVFVSRWLALPAQAQYLGDSRYAVQGSLGPLLAMWSVFVVRYVATVTLILHPTWSHGTAFGVVLPAVYGALSGMFLARSLRILRTGPAAALLSPA